MSWQSEPLSALTLKIGSGSTPRGGDSVYISEGTTLIRSQNVYNNEFSTDGLVYIDEKTAEKMKGVSVEKEDVLVNITGDSVARCCLVHDAVLPARVNQHVAILRTNPKKLLPHFLAFYMVSPFMQAKMLSWAGTGGTRKALTKGMLEGFEIPLPPVDVQDKIVQKIRTYNDLIENNRRRIQLLEESARLLYQEWFVHLRFPGHEKVKITDGVPEGWEQSSIGEASSYLNRGITPKYSDDGEYVVINQKCIRNRVLSLELARRQSKEYKEEKAVRLGDILINSTGTGTLGRVAQVWEECEKTSVDTHVTIVRPATDIPYLWLGYCLLGMERRLEDMGEGATNQKELKRQYVADISILKPSNSLMEMFHNTVLDNTKQIQNLIKANKSLAQARDLLLPKLMSGELTV
ncbi:restriction endonuclease subunit S [Thiopseudomonas alkaliphila]|uniref:restriction endonuclease subunit S n=2 Tax=Gammaproteobacteria TaxID=1236 RepID=UPI002575A34F|nr:restriction endonuclease subunit S [Thiopseudomonas alkaliphila]MDM1708388.1 restriction endonuclease subunit S [Thiopseudomonas alkaliphila]